MTNKSAEFTLVIGNKNYSSWSLRPWLVLRHFGIPFEEILIPLRQPQSKEEILKHSPSGKVPVLKHKNLVVWETLAIGEYLADLFPEKQLWPKDSRARAIARAVSSEMHAGFMDLRKTFPMDVRAHKPDAPRSPEVLKDIRRITQIWEECRQRFGQSGEFLFGKFCIADTMFAPVVFRLNTYGVDLSGEAKKYSTAMLNLPAMQEWRDAAVQEPHVINH